VKNLWIIKRLGNITQVKKKGEDTISDKKVEDGYSDCLSSEILFWMRRQRELKRTRKTK